MPDGRVDILQMLAKEPIVKPLPAHPQEKRVLLANITKPGYTGSLADYENDPMRTAAPEEKFSRSTIVGSITKDFVYDAHLDDSLFRFDVPKGYAIKTQKRHLVTEQEMLDFVRLLVGADGGVFPDQIMDIPSDVYNKYNHMPKSDRSPEIQKLMETVDHYDKILRDGERPMRAFLEHNAAWISFSVWVSTLEVESSRIRMRGSINRARAIATR